MLLFFLYVFFVKLTKLSAKWGGLLQVSENGERYWFTADEEKELMEHNRPFYAYPPTHDVFFRCFRLPEEGEECELRPSGELYARLASDYPKEMRGMNLNRFGRLLTSIGAERVHTVKGNMYKVVMVA